MATASGSGSGSGPWKRSKNNKPGLISKIKGKIRVTKMDWTPENDNKLLLLGLGKELKPADYQTIADSYKGELTHLLHHVLNCANTPRDRATIEEGRAGAPGEASC